MTYRFHIPFNGCNWAFTLLPYGDFQSIFVSGFCDLRVTKNHDHSYELAGYFFLSRYYVYPVVFRRKRDLFGAIQKLLQEQLNTGVQ